MTSPDATPTPRALSGEGVLEVSGPQGEFRLEARGSSFDLRLQSWRQLHWLRRLRGGRLANRHRPFPPLVTTGHVLLRNRPVATFSLQEGRLQWRLTPVRFLRDRA